MSTNSKVSFRALRVLTYTVLSKAIIDAVMLVSRLTGRHVLLTVAQAAEFVCIVACVMCLGGVIALSRKFEIVRRIMVIMLILECITLLMVIFETQMIISSYSAAAADLELIAHASITAKRLLLGVAFLLFMKGFAEILKKEGDDASATNSERMGTVFLCINSIASIVSAVSAFAVTTGRATFVVVPVLLEVAGMILEVLMYRKSSDTARLLWRKRAGVTEERTILP